MQAYSSSLRLAFRSRGIYNFRPISTSASASRGLLGNYLREGLKKNKQVPTVFLLPRSAGSLAMATQRDVSAQSDISKMQAEGDGSFKRKPSTFRNFIEKGGKFEPEKGERMLSGILSFFLFGFKLIY